MQLAADHRLQEPQVLDLDLLRLAQACSAQRGLCRTGVDVQLNRHGSTKVIGERLIESVAARLPAYSSAPAVLVATMRLRPGLDQELPVQDHAPLTDFR